jgi:hypothetical protein
VYAFFTGWPILTTAGQLIALLAVLMMTEVFFHHRIVSLRHTDLSNQNFKMYNNLLQPFNN